MKTPVRMAHDILADLYPADSPVRAVAAQLIEYDQLFELQQKRIKQADKMWQRATGRDVWPDLGELLTWLLARIETLEQEVRECQTHTNR